MRLYSTGRPVVTSFPFLFSAFFLFTFYWLFRYCQLVSSADPTSLFFDPAWGYQRHYSLQRQHEAEEFIKNAAHSPLQPQGGIKPPRLCVGIPTVAREGESYLGATVGSLLAGLNATERAELHVAVLIAHSLPSKHAVFHEAWLEHSVDKVLVYNNISGPVFSNLTRWEKDRSFGKKGLFDYVYVLHYCATIGAEWIAMIEDDTLAVEGWYPRVIEALRVVNDQMEGSKQGDWLYLRLFFTEEFLGWNIENLPSYLTISTMIMIAVSLSLLLLRHLAFSRYLSKPFIVIATFIYTPSFILLYFAAGRLTVLPLHPGVHQMPRYGCCGQGLVFPSATALRAASFLTGKGEGFVDELLEAWANKEGMVRWAVVPSLLQHIGMHSSKGDDFGSKAEWGRSVAEKIWSFGFERHGVSRS